MQKNIIFQIFASFIWFSSLHTNNDLGEIFDCLMGKYNDPDYQACMQNKSRTPWFTNSTRAYSFARSAFEKYSIERSRTECSLQIPKIIHQIWLGGEVPAKYADWMSTWTKHHPNWTYILWTDGDIKYLDLTNEDLFDKAKNYGEKSDILRLELVNTFGGLYIDTDYQCLKPFDQFHYYNTFYVSALNYGFNTNNALIGCSQKHPLAQKLVENLKNSAKCAGLSERTGPIYFTRIIYREAPLCNNGVVIYPPRYFTPNQSLSRAYDHINTYAIHWFDASWGKTHEKEKKISRNTSMEQRLTRLYFRQKAPQQNQAENINILSDLISHLPIKTIVELGACQFLINNEILDNIQYIGISPIKFLVLDYRLRYPDENRNYLWKDWSEDSIASSDLLIIGDILEYLPFKYCKKVLNKAKTSNAQFLMIAHDENVKNENIVAVQKRSLNMCRQPFNFPEPEQIIYINNQPYGIWQNNI